MHASSTSCLPQLLGGLSSFFAQQPEVKSELHANQDATLERIRCAMRGTVNGWYAEHRERVVFDKSRAWSHYGPLLADLFPDAKLILCVRDLRDVFASVERQHRSTLVLDDAADPYGRTVYGRADRMFGPTGVIGAPIQGIEDLLRRRVEPIVLTYEYFVRAPGDAMRKLYAGLGLDYFEHDFAEVQSTATDLDALYLNKFPHDGSGKVEPRGTTWHDVVPQDIASTIIGRFPAYNRAFGYGGV